MKIKIVSKLKTLSAALLGALTLGACGPLTPVGGVKKGDWFTQTVTVKYGVDIFEYDMLCAPKYYGPVGPSILQGGGKKSKPFRAHAPFPKWAMFDVDEGLLLVELHCPGEVTRRSTIGPFENVSSKEDKLERERMSRMFLFTDLNNEDEVAKFIFHFKLSEEQREELRPKFLTPPSFPPGRSEARDKYRDKMDVFYQLENTKVRKIGALASKATENDLFVSYGDNKKLSFGKKKEELKRVEGEIRRQRKYIGKLIYGIKPYSNAFGGYSLYQHGKSDPVYKKFCNQIEQGLNDKGICK